MCAAGFAHRLFQDCRSQPQWAGKGYVTAGGKAVKQIYRPGPKTGHEILAVDYTNICIAVIDYTSTS